MQNGTLAEYTGILPIQWENSTVELKIALAYVLEFLFLEVSETRFDPLRRIERLGSGPLQLRR